MGRNARKKVEPKGVTVFEPTGKLEMKIPNGQVHLAKAPIDSPLWRGGQGFGLTAEFLWIEGGGWLVTNSKVGPYRMRHICKIIKTVRVEKVE